MPFADGNFCYLWDERRAVRPTCHRMTRRAIELIAAALFVLVASLVVATVAARFVGRDEHRMRREMHQDIRMLREQVEKLREELMQMRALELRAGQEPMHPSSGDSEKGT